MVRLGRLELGDHDSIDHDWLEGSQETRFPYLLTTRTRFIGFGGFDMIDQKQFSLQGLMRKTVLKWAVKIRRCLVDLRHNNLLL